jgi:hypothetical protein
VSDLRRRRVSTDAQDLTSQLAQLKAAGCERVFREKICRFLEFFTAQIRNPHTRRT